MLSIHDTLTPALLKSERRDRTLQAAPFEVQRAAAIAVQARQYLQTVSRVTTALELALWKQREGSRLGFPPERMAALATDVVHASHAAEFLLLTGKPPKDNAHA